MPLIVLFLFYQTSFLSRVLFTKRRIPNGMAFNPVVFILSNVVFQKNISNKNYVLAYRIFLAIQHNETNSISEKASHLLQTRYKTIA